MALSGRGMSLRAACRWGIASARTGWRSIAVSRSVSVGSVAVIASAEPGRRRLAE